MSDTDTRSATAAATVPGRLAGRRAVITGATSGIGFETARRFVEEGAEVIVTGRNAARLDAAVEALGPRARGVVADVVRMGDLHRLAAEAKAAFGRVDIVFANAGSGVFGPLGAIDEAAFDAQFATNVKGVFFTLQALEGVLAEGASVVLNASAVSGKGVAMGSVYFATKAAIRSFARSLAAELAPRGIRVNTLSPGIVRTGFQAATNVGEEGSEGFVQMVVAQAPLGREGTPREMADAALFLASAESAYVTGTDLVVDGGWSQV
ncbi:MAG: SDR family oxidoreductase [Pseudomonadota bacterium]